MTGVIASLQILFAAIAASLLLVRWRHAALLTAMLGIVAASLITIVSALQVLLQAQPATAVEVAWPLPLGELHLAIDGLSAWFLVTLGVLSACVAFYSIQYMSSGHGQTAHPVYGVLFCWLTASMILTVCAADAVVFLLGWEAMTVAAFLAIAFDHRRAEVRSGAWIYLVATHIGTALCVLPLFGILTASAESVEFSGFLSAAQHWSARTVTVAFVLGLLGFGTKAGFMPMHVWLPAAHPVAPTPISAVLSGVVVKMGIYGLLRLLTWLPPLPAGCAHLLLVVALVSGVMGVLYALAQHDLKRLLAYHTVENIGIIALGIGMGILGQSTGHVAIAALGYAGALLHVANHALFKGLLFLSAGAVLHGAGTTDIESLGGLAKSTPGNATLFLIGAVAICGLPPLNGFVSEWVIYGSLFTSVTEGVRASAPASVLGMVALALMGGLALACFCKVFGVVFLGSARNPDLRVRRTPPLMRAGMAALALACVSIGLMPGAVLPMAGRATCELLRMGSPQSSAAAMERVLAPARTLTLLAIVLLACVFGLALLRRWLTRPAAAVSAAHGEVATWGCGFTQPTPRMQYSASSFADSLVRSFRHLLWPQRTLDAPAGPFPHAGHLESSTPDLAYEGLFVPVFRGISRLSTLLRTLPWHDGPAKPVHSQARGRTGPIRVVLQGVVGALRHGSIQVHLAFIVLTLLVVFLIETTSPLAGWPPTVNQSGASAGGIEP